MLSNAEKLNAAVALAIADAKFIGNTDKVNKAIDALTPKSTVTATFKRLQGNARKDFLDNQDSGKIGYTEDNRAAKIRDYVSNRFQTYIDDPKTANEAKDLFNATFPVEDVGDSEEEAA